MYRGCCEASVSVSLLHDRSSFVFSWKTKCFFCTNDASLEFVAAERKKEKHEHTAVHIVMKMVLREIVTKAAKERNKERGLGVISRMTNVDRIASEGT